MNKLIRLICTVGLILSFVGCTNKEGVPVETTATTRATEKIEVAPEKKEVKKEFGGELRMSMRNPKFLNPLINLDHSVDKTLKLIFESLFVIGEDGKPKSNLVESYLFSDDFSNVTLTLKDDILFHNGDLLTSDDVAYSIQLIKAPNSQSLYSDAVSNIQRYSIIDDNNIKIYFKQSYAFPLYDLTFPIVNKLNETDEGSYEPIGTGPYSFVSFTNMKALKLTYYNDYREKYWVKDINCTITRDEAAENNAFKQNLIDIVTPTKFNWQQYSEDEVSNIYEYTSNYYEFIGFNYNNDLLKKKEIRHAFASSINREKIISQLYLAHGVITDSIVKPNSYLKNRNDIVYPYSLEDGKTVFDKYTNNGLISFSLLVNEDNTIRMAMADMIKKDMKAVGVELEIDSVSRSEFMEKLKAKDFDLVITAIKLGYKPDYTDLFHKESIEEGNNFISYNSENMNALLDNIYKAPTEKQLLSRIEEFDDYFVEEMPYLSLFFLNSIVISNNDIYGDLNIMRENKQLDIKEIYISR